MVENLDKYRNQLYSNIKTENPNYSRKDFDANFKTQKFFEAFVETILKKKKDKPNSHWGQIVANSKGTFYRTYACDMPWATNSNYCVGSTPTPIPTPITNMGDYVGTFQDTNTATMFSITSNNNKLFVDVLDVKKEYPNIELIPSNEKNTFEVTLPQMSDSSIINTLTSSVKGKIVFSVDLKTLTYSFGSILSGTAKKIESNINTNKTDNKNTSTDSSNKNTGNKVKSDDDQKYKLYQNVINFGPDKPFKVDTIPTRECTDFPFTFGCKNPLIGDINQVISNNRLSDVYDSHLNQDLNNNDFFKQPGEKQGEISKHIYDQIMSLKESKLKKKIIKETVKKVLKEYIIKK